MAKIKVLAGDFLKAEGSFNWDTLYLKTEKHLIMGERINVSELETIEPASEDNVKKIGGTLGWGAVGGLAFGPLGALGGIILGGKGKEVTFVAQFKDGRKLMATTDSETFKKLQAAVFQASIAPNTSHGDASADSQNPDKKKKPVGCISGCLIVFLAMFILVSLLRACQG